MSVARDKERGLPKIWQRKWLGYGGSIEWVLKSIRSNSFAYAAAAAEANGCHCLFLRESA